MPDVELRDAVADIIYCEALDDPPNSANALETAQLVVDALFALENRAALIAEAVNRGVLVPVEQFTTRWRPLYRVAPDA